MRFVSIFTLAAAACLAQSPEAAFEQAMKALAVDDYPTALAKLETAVESDPDNQRFASAYRQAVIKAHEHDPKADMYDRCLSFFEKLVEAAPKSANAHLNYGFAYVDKMPTSGSITQVLLANTALSHFTKSIELEPNWIGLYTRGNSYLYWPTVFGRAPLGVADLEQAMEIQKSAPLKSYHVRVYVALGDAYWKTEDLEKARAIWSEGLERFPDDFPDHTKQGSLKARLSKQGDELKAYLDQVYDPSKRVDTDLRQLWMD